MQEYPEPEKLGQLLMDLYKEQCAEQGKEVTFQEGTEGQTA